MDLVRVVQAEVVHSSVQLEDLDLYQLLSYELDASSIAMYQRDIETYVLFTLESGLDWLQSESLMYWRDDLVLHTSLSPLTINRMLSAVRRLIKELVIRKRLTSQVLVDFEHVPGVKQKNLRHRLKENARTPISPDEMLAICDAPNPATIIGLRDRALLETLATSGLRASELATLRLTQVKRRDGGYYLLVTGKTDIKPREALLSIEAYTRIQAWIEARPVQSEYIFTSFRTRAVLPSTKPISEVAVWNIVTRYAKQCGLPDVKPHDLRRFLGTQLAKTDIRKAQKALGHKRIETTARHYVLDEIEIGMSDHLFRR